MAQEVRPVFCLSPFQSTHYEKRLYGMIVRVRTNLGSWRVKVIGDGVTLDELRQEISTQYKVALNAVRLTGEDGLELNNGTDTLCDLGISNGAMLVINDTLVQHKIEKSYIEDGILIEAGIRIVGSSSSGDKSDDNTARQQGGEKTCAVQQKEVDVPVGAPPSADEDNATNNPYSVHVADSKGLLNNRKSRPTPEDHMAADAALAAALSAEDATLATDVRRPDQSKKMCLYDDEHDAHIDMPYVGGSPDILERQLVAGPRESSLRQRREDRQVSASTTEEVQVAEDTLAAARAAGVDEEELRQMADELLAERIQAKLLSESPDLQFDDHPRAADCFSAGGPSLLHRRDQEDQTNALLRMAERRTEHRSRREDVAAATTGLRSHSNMSMRNSRSPLSDLLADDDEFDEEMMRALSESAADAAARTLAQANTCLRSADDDMDHTSLEASSVSHPSHSRVRDKVPAGVASDSSAKLSSHVGRTGPSRRRQADPLPDVKEQDSRAPTELTINERTVIDARNLTRNVHGTDRSTAAPTSNRPRLSAAAPVGRRVAGNVEPLSHALLSSPSTSEPAVCMRPSGSGTTDDPFTIGNDSDDEFIAQAIAMSLRDAPVVQEALRGRGTDRSSSSGIRTVPAASTVSYDSGTGNDAGLDEDEMLARALQESLRDMP